MRNSLGVAAGWLVIGLASGTMRAGEPGSSGSFTKAVRESRLAVFLVGDPRVGTGTAWVLSQKHRLLATNAHVADMFFKSRPGEFQAMMNGSDQTWKVERAWYHPGVRRFPTPDMQLWVRATDAKVGGVNPRGPDLAVLQLSKDGPELPPALKLAAPKIVVDLQTLPAGILGYPGHDTKDWPLPGKKVLATFHEGVISRVSDFELEGGGPDELAQFLQYTMQTYGGFSGSPIFLPSGEVVGVHCMSRPISKTDQRRIAHGIRIDGLWELLSHHKLTELVPIPLAEDKLALDRYRDADPRWKLYQQLDKLRRDADYLIYTTEDYAAGIAKCDEAILLFADYAPAYKLRCYGFNNWWFDFSRQWSQEKQLDHLNKALKDAQTYRNLHAGPTVDTVSAVVTVYNNLGRVTGQRKYNILALDNINDLLDGNLSPFDRASALSSKGVALSNLDRPDDARKAHDQALQLHPDGASLWETRASFLENNNDPGQARKDRQLAAQLRKRDRLLHETKGQEKKVVYQFTEALTAKNDRDASGRYFHNYKFELEEGYLHQIDVKSTAYKKSGDFDPLIRLRNDKDQLIQQDDDSGGLPHARIFFTPTRGGEYRLIVTSFDRNQTGEFEVIVTRVAKEK